MSFTPVQQAFAEAITQGIFSGAQFRVGKGQQTFYAGSFGTHTRDSGSPQVTEASLFDVASLTKPVVTASLMMRRVEAGQLDLQDPIQKYLPEFNHSKFLTLEMLLAHVSGLAAWRPFFEKISLPPPSHPEVRQKILLEMAQLPLEASPGTRRIYSDLGFILLGFLLETLSRKSLTQLFSEEIARPLGLTNSLFNPLQGPSPRPVKEIVATEQNVWKDRLLQGEVMDENAFVLGGFAGHAGLFSTAEDLEKFVQVLWQAWEGEGNWLQPDTLERFIGRKVSPKLGWDTVSPPASQAGKYFSGDSVGHLAFTGCSLWLDPADQKYVILLTNRVHPTRTNDAIKEFRPRIHDLGLQCAGLIA